MSAATVQSANTAEAAGTDLNIGNLQGYEFLCEQEGFRYYNNSETGKQCCIDSNGYWYVFDEKSGAFMPLNAEQPVKKTRKDDNKADKLRNVQRFGIKFDHNGRPIFPKNEQGLFVLPKDEKGLPFFPVDDRGKPIFPYDPSKGDLTFPVDDSEEPIFPRNEMNKPIVPSDKEDKPIFPVDKTGAFIFPLDENNCPIPGLTFEGVPVIPKDSFGNFVIPTDRDGKKLIHIASDGVTPISASEWKQWKKFYKEQARNFYHQQQQQSQQKQMTMAADSGNYHMFHPLSLEQQNLYYAADMEMLQRSQRESMDIPPNAQEMQYSAEKGMENGVAQNVDPKELKRKKLLAAQLKSVKKGANQPIQPKKEEKRMEKDVKKENRKEKQRKPEKPVTSRRKEDIQKRNKRRSRSPIRKRQRRYASRSRSSSSYSRSRSRSSSRSTIPRRRRGGNNKGRRSPSTHSSSSSYSGSSSSYSSNASSNSSYSRRSSKMGKNEIKKANEENEMRNRILSRTNHSHSQGSEAMKMEKEWKPVEAAKEEEPEEYGPKPPANMENGSDMEMSDVEGGDEIIGKQNEHDGHQGIGQQKYEEIGEAQNHAKQEVIEENTKKGDDKKNNKEAENPTNSIKEETCQLPKGPFNVKEVLKSEQIELIRMCKQQEREKYDQLKLELAELGVALSVHKRNWTQLREAEKRLESKRGIEFLSSSDES